MILSAIDEGWSKEDWQLAAQERAAILEHDECLPRARANSLAIGQTYTRYGQCPPE